MLTEDTLREAVDALAEADADLAAIVEAHGYPPLWEREPGFATLVLLILEQQVSLASARAAFGRLAARLGRVAPEGLLGLDDAELRDVGFSRQKARYARSLATALVDGTLALDGLAAADDATVRSSLVALPGIGPWTADVYLLMVLRRPDVWPTGDVALQAAAQRAKALPARPTAGELEAIGEAWRPHRSSAARLLWHLYLSERRAPR